MSEQALATRDSMLPALGGVEGLEGLDPGDLIIPRLQIMQPGSRVVIEGDVPPGSFYCNLSGECYEALTIVPMFFPRGRLKYVQGEDRPVCKSDDGLRPSRFIESPVAEVCAKIVNGRLTPVCPDAVWENGNKPPCAATYNMVALNLDQDAAPFILTLKGTCYKVGKRLISYFSLRKLSPFAISCKMATTKQTNSMGTFFVAEFSAYERVDPPDQYREQFLALRDYDMNKTTEAEEAIDAETDEDEAGNGDGLY